LLGRDSTLSGRTRLWTLAIASGGEHPLLGAGYRSFWLESAAGSIVMDEVSWGNQNIGNGHSAYIDLWLELGLVGLIAWGLFLWQSCGRVIRMINVGDPLGPAMAAVLLHTSLYAFTERVLLEHSDLGWIFIVALFVQSSPGLACARLDRSRPKQEGQAV
jgi:O-antigen ligase